MTATATLTTDLQRQVLALETDLRTRLAADPEREGEWKREHHRAVEKERTAASWVDWRDDRITQAAVAWVLTAVFIRFCEDNALLKPVWITGPGPRRQEALDAQKEFFRRHPEDTGREWLLDAIDYLAKLPATRGLVESHSALHLVAPSGDAADALLEFWRRRDEDGNLVHDLADPELSTRFLGDLYQDLSQHAKDAYALLQTPVFVEEFILDRTMEPALAERPLEGFKMIDPACGSGHFLLGAFARLLDRWHRRAPGLDTQARAQKALDAINGVDLNPFAVAIARFRLLLAAFRAAGLRSLEQAPAFTVNLAAGDSLIHGPDPDVLPGMADRSAYMPFTYRTEDADLLLTLLEEGRYDVVVGNPPYIAVRDKALNQIYRGKYADVCKGTYALTVPFMKLMFSLAKPGELAGWVGQITSNSFMKREFGAKLIENYLTRIDLQVVADTSGAYIPGHGTPTVIIIGRNRGPEASTVRAILGIRGEPGRPDDPAKGLVWTAITEHVDQPGWNDDWITIADLDRPRLATHPWSLSGGGAVELIKRIEDEASRRMRSVITPPIGRSIRAGADEAFLRPATWHPSSPALAEQLRPIVIGENVRDWKIDFSDKVLYPYLYGTSRRRAGQLERELWPWRTLLAARVTFSGDMAAADLQWWEVHAAYEQRLQGCFVYHLCIRCYSQPFRAGPRRKSVQSVGTSDQVAGRVDRA
jgi:Eco57I restriction-modification methylase